MGVRAKFCGDMRPLHRKPRNHRPAYFEKPKGEAPLDWFNSNQEAVIGVWKPGPIQIK